MREIPNGWIERTLSELSKGKGEYGIGNSACEDREGAVKYLRITDIDDNGKYVNNGAYVYDDNIKSYLLNKNDMVFARTGASVGKSYLYNEKDGELAYAGFLIKFSIKDEICNPGILKYNFYSSAYEKWVKVMSSRSGQPGINAEEYSGYKLCIPQKREEQDKIVSILDCWAKAIELQENKIKKLEEKKKALMQKFLKPQEGWGELQFEEICDCYQSQTIPQNQFLTTGYKVYGANGFIGYYNKFNHEKWQVVLSCRGNCGTINKTEDNSWINGNAMVLNLKDECHIDKTYFYYQCLATSFNDVIDDSGIPQITCSSVKNKIFKFEEDVLKQKMYAQLFVALDIELKLEQNLLDNYKNQLKSLMQKLLTGKVRVNG